VFEPTAQLQAVAMCWLGF